MRIIGFKKNDFTAEKTGEVINGYSVYLAYIIASEKGFGYQPLNKNYWISAKKFNENNVEDICRKGIDIEPTFNVYGKLSGFKVIE